MANKVFLIGADSNGVYSFNYKPCTFIKLSV
jgi:hypothetical protein